ncbi:MAG TPA: VOC family protein [Ignavibacteria bacterium]|nr:VOC family protein [Ignavibacteria bacterium]HMR40634.1 VOC family protein [Ignavibacteria bacterium]
MKNAINWFAIPSSDFQRAVKFYNEIFGFELNVSKMGDADLAFFPCEQGGVGDHIYISRNPVTSENGPILYLNGGDDLQIVLDKVESAGGKISQPKVQVSPDVGFVAMFEDTEGNRVALHSVN